MFTSSFKATLDQSIEDTVSYRVGSEFNDGLKFHGMVTVKTLIAFNLMIMLSKRTDHQKE